MSTNYTEKIRNYIYEHGGKENIKYENICLEAYKYTQINLQTFSDFQYILLIKVVAHEFAVHMQKGGGKIIEYNIQRRIMSYQICVP
ncbi:hypothetical protein V1477_002096 [Vespula maculifrons]|uniref:Uncharacterized protein n=1 Tax=Vespula maculifrons TaxID=7453 RepID=A0ABD2CZG8_VESMC